MNPNRQSNQGTKALSPPECPRFLYSCLSFPALSLRRHPLPGHLRAQEAMGSRSISILSSVRQSQCYAIRTTSSTLDIGQTPKRLAGHYRPTRLEARGTPMEAGQDRPCRVPVSMKSSWRILVFLLWGGTACRYLGVLSTAWPRGPGAVRIAPDADRPDHSVHHGYIAPPLEGSSQGGRGAPRPPWEHQKRIPVQKPTGNFRRPRNRCGAAPARRKRGTTRTGRRGHPESFNN